MRLLAVLLLLVTANASAQEFTPYQLELGNKLFHDPRLSADGTISCATCHNPKTGFTDGLTRAIGIGGQAGNMATPTILGAFDDPLQFPNGRTIGIQLQSLQPLVNPVEMGNGSTQEVVNRINRIPGYRALFVQAYGGLCNERRLSHAIAAFESLCQSPDAPVDKRLAGYTRSLSEQAERGFQLFVAFDCASCHAGADYSDAAFHNNGVTFFTEGLNADDQGRIDVLPQGSPRTAETVRAWKTPTLRELWQTGPYMHHGSFATLEEVVEGYNRGWQKPVRARNGAVYLGRDRFQDERIRPLGMTEQQKADLTVFLKEGFRSDKYPNIDPPRLPR